MKNKLNPKFIFSAIIVLVATISFAQVSVGVASDTPSAVSEQVEITKEINGFEFLMKGGFFLIPIGILLFYTIVVIVERMLFIRRMTQLNKNMLNQIKGDLSNGNIQGALNSISNDQTAYANVVREGVLTVKRGGKSIEQTYSKVEANMEKVANIEIGKMEKNIGHLGLIAGIAPTIGFIGTISGVIKIFYMISITENVSIGNISGGLYEKMISSGSGLIVGIIAFTGYHLLNGMIDNFALAIQRINLEFVKLIQSPSDGDKA